MKVTGNVSFKIRRSQSLPLLPLLQRLLLPPLALVALISKPPVPSRTALPATRSPSKAPMTAVPRPPTIATPSPTPAVSVEPLSGLTAPAPPLPPALPMAPPPRTFLPISPAAPTSAPVNPSRFARTRRLAPVTRFATRPWFPPRLKCPTAPRARIPICTTSALSLDAKSRLRLRARPPYPTVPRRTATISKPLPRTVPTERTSSPSSIATPLRMLVIPAAQFPSLNALVPRPRPENLPP
mmetsp:Transcript_17540/g.38767  ORF Transcript_17540/g.38767 Transcript_17540/m.38767 type:complete len:240 (+) Transcript_17540:212-931(+)